MESGNVSGMGNGSDCEGLHDKQVHEIFGLVVPNDNNWSERTPAWFVFFYLMVIVFGLLFATLGITCIVLMWKRHLAKRFKVNTFIAIDLALMTLGFSRVLFFLLDPWGQSEYFNCKGCIIVSRLLGALAFPSLTASYTLVFITLWLSARIQLGRSCVQNLKVLIPLCCVHYVVAILFEIIGSLPVSKYPILFLLIGCEAVFAVWGFIVCVAFLFAGQRLLRSVKMSAKKSSVVCRDSPHMTRQDLIDKSRFQNHSSQDRRQRSRSTMKLKTILREHHKRAIRKVTLITYVTATLGMAYSMLNILNLSLLSVNLFKGCPGYYNSHDKLQPGIWLGIKYISLILELSLAVLLIYSISDIQPVLNFLSTSCCGMKYILSRRSTPEVDIESNPPSSVAVPGAAMEPSPLVKRDFKASKDTLEDCVETGKGDLESTIVISGNPFEKISESNGTTQSPLTVSFSMQDNKR